MVIFGIAACRKSETSTATARTEAASIPDTKLSGTFWLLESQAGYTGLAFTDGLNAEIITFDVSDKMHTEKGEYIFFNDAFGAFYYNSIPDYTSLLQELENSYKAKGEEKSESDLKQELFQQGGIELLFQLKEDGLEIFGSFLHEKELNNNVNLYNFKAVNLTELQKIFTAYRSN